MVPAPTLPPSLPANWQQSVTARSWRALADEDLATILRWRRQTCSRADLEAVFKEMCRRLAVVVRVRGRGLGGRMDQVVQAVMSEVARVLIVPASRDGDALCVDFKKRAGLMTKREVGGDKHSKREKAGDEAELEQHPDDSLERQIRLLEVNDFLRRLRAVKDPRHRFAIHLIFFGETIDDIADVFCRKRDTIREWIKDFIANDPDRMP